MGPILPTGVIGVVGSAQRGRGRVPSAERTESTLVLAIHVATFPLPAPADHGRSTRRRLP
jgi:hypothetical protein